MIISDIVLNRDCPTTDVIMNTGLTITDVIIYDLAHFADLYSDDLNPTAIILKTSADVMPYIIMFDHSTQKTDSAIVRLKSSCDNIKTATSFPLGESQMALKSLLDTLVLKALLSVNENEMILKSQPATVCCYCPMTVDSNMAIKTAFTKDLTSEVYMLPISFELTNIDDVYIAELDPFTLPEIDMMNGYYHGMRLQAEFALQSIMYIASNELSSTLQSSMSLSIFPLVKDYDDWFITDMDSHSIHHLEKEIE